MTSFVDTNVFIHFLLGYDQQQFEACRDLLRAAEDERAQLETSAMVIAELVWFLERPPLNTPPAAIRSRIEPLLGIRGLKLPDPGLVASTLEQYAESSMNFVDAYDVVLMRRRRIARIYSYDTDFDGVPGLKRVEP